MNKIIFLKSKYLILLLLIFTFQTSFTQNNNSTIDVAGDIAFVAYHDTLDGFSFIFLDDCPVNTIISFIDDEWLGSNWAGNSEGELVWQNNSGNVITKGTVIDVTNADDNGVGISATAGSIYENDIEDTPNYSGFNTNTGNTDEIYAIAGRRSNLSSTFLAFVGRAGTSTLTGTGLINGTTAHEYSSNMATYSEGYYTGTTNFSGSLATVAATINSSSNWTSGSFTFPGSVPNSFSGSAFVVAVAPTVTTTAASSVVNTSATLAGNVTADGGDAVTGRGIVYSITALNANPTIGGANVTQDTNGTGTGVFTKSITGLAAGTGYSFNSYAINGQGTSYGTVATFTTTGKGWTGATDTDWATASNWSPATIPLNSDNVVIPNVTNKPIISSSTGAVANDITIDANSSLTVNSGGTLIINGTATVNGDFNYKVNVADTKWHLISSPVLGEQYDDTWNDTNGINTTGTGNNEAVASYINTSDANGDWVYYQDGNSATTFASAKGYSLQRTGVGSYTFTGTFPAPPINSIITAENVGNANENRWNLVGNPNPAYINIATFLSTNTVSLTDSHVSVYVWNPNAGTEGEYQDLQSGYIHPGQAFFISSKYSFSSVSFTKAMQSDQNGVTFYKTTPNPKLTLFMADDTNSKSTEINYLEGKTIGLDPGFDIGTFTGQSSSLNVYTHLVSNSEGVNFKRQALPDTNYENMIIPVGVSAIAGKEITFTAQGLNLPTGIKIFLEDKITNTFTRLDEANTNYKVTPTENLSEIGRFYLHTTNSALNVDKNLALDNVSIYKIDKSTLRIVGLSQGKSTIKMFNVLGKQVLNATFNSNGVSEINVSQLATGVYIVQLENEAGSLNKKIVLE